MTDSTTPPPAQPTPAYADPAVAGPKLNVLAIVSLVTSILWLSIVGIITGHIALSQIKKRGEGGRVLALIGTILGYVGSVLWIISWVLWIGIFIAAANSGGVTTYGY